MLAGCDLLSYNAKTVKVHFVDGDDEALTIMDYNTKVVKPDDPTPKPGYKFIGWYLNDELFDFETPYGYGGPLTSNPISVESQFCFLDEITAFAKTNNVINDSDITKIKKLFCIRSRTS